MVLTENQFGQSDLETLAQMGVTTDRSGRLRIGHAVAKEMGLGGGRWLKREEEAKVSDSIKGYHALPDLIKAGSAYSTIERFHLAAVAGANGVPDLTEAYAQMQACLEERLEATKVRHASDGLPQRTVLAAYWKQNKELEGKGYAPLTTRQFVDGLVDHVEQYLRDAEIKAKQLIEGSKAELVANPKAALDVAVDASYLLWLVAAVRPKLDAVRNNGSNTSKNVEYGLQDGHRIAAPAQ